MFDEIRNERVDAIVIAGDIVHTKTQGISPEIIDHLTWWFKSFAEIAPTYVTLGNHDGLIHNADRQDAIGPIINAINSNNIKFMKKSGNFPTHMEGVRIANFSPFDEEGWDDVSREGEVVIAIFHGVVKGSLTDADFATESEVDVDFFKGCHYGMFGDIHKHQFLDKDKRFAYPGSTIQQNFGESQDKGYLLWEISGPNTFSVERRLIESPHPYVTIKWAGNVDETIEQLRYYKRGSRFRISSSETILQEEIKQISSYLKEVLDACEIVWKWDTEVEHSKANTYLETTRKSLRDAESHRPLLLSALNDEANIDKHVDVVSKILNSIEDDDDVVRNQKWTIEKLEWENTFSYGKNNIIDFKEMSGVVGIFGKNKIGKSSIPGTMMYAFFNATDRGPMKAIHIVNTRKGHCAASADFKVDGVPYKIERLTSKTTNRKGETFASTNLNLFRLDESGDNLLDLSGEQRKDSEKALKRLVGTSNDFLLTSFAAQGEMNNFIKHGATHRKALLSRFLDLQVLESVFHKLKEESSSLKAVLKSLPDRNFRTLRSDYLVSIEDCDKKISQSDQEILILENEKSDLTQRLSGLETQKHYSESDVNEIENQLAKCNEDLSSENENLKTLEAKIADSVRKISAIEQIKLKFPIAEMKAKIEEHSLLEKKCVETKHLVDREFLVLTSQEKSASKLDEVPCGESFPTCKFIKDSIKDKKLIDSQKKKLDELKESFKAITNILNANDINDVIEKVKKFNDALTKEKILVSEKSSLESRALLSKGNIERLISRSVKLKGDFEHAKSNVSNSPEVEIASLNRKKLLQINQQLQAARSVTIESSKKKAICQEKLRVLDSEEARLVEVKAQWSFYDKLMGAYNKDGIPMLIIRNELPRINGEISKILHGVVGFTVTLETDKSGSDLEIFIDYGDSQRPIELGSGMEKMLASLAIRVALINISSLPKSDILIIDEGFGALDEQNIEACTKLLHSLKRFFKTILIISHVDAIKDAVDGFIEISTIGADAHVSAIDTL
jgi:DNA repair exonuclease SbcCD ATPase subunit/DNA repair exonuclease SbcCD nuclease subunit